MTTFNSIDNVLSNFYLDVISELLNRHHPFLSAIERTSSNVWGKEIRKAVRFGDEYEVLKMELANLYGTITISDKAVRASANNSGALVNLLNAEIEDMLKNTKCDIDKQLFNGGGIVGFNDIFQKSGSLYGVRRDKCPQLIPYIKEDFGELTESKLTDVIDKLGHEPDFIITTYENRNRFKDFSDCRIIELKNGYSAYSWNGIVIIADTNCPEDTLYILNSKDFIIHQLCDWMWLRHEDGTILKQHSAKPIHTATLVKYANLMCTNPSHQAMLTGVLANNEIKRKED